LPPTSDEVSTLLVVKSVHATTGSPLAVAIAAGRAVDAGRPFGATTVFDGKFHSCPVVVVA